MASLNKVELIGRLGNDLELRSLPNSDATVNLSVATSKSWTDEATQERKEKTTWHRVVLYRDLAERAAKYLKKGALVRIEGELSYRTYIDQQNIERAITEIKGLHLLMLAKAPEEKKAAEQGAEPPADDVPF